MALPTQSCVLHLSSIALDPSIKSLACSTSINPPKNSFTLHASPLAAQNCWSCGCTQIQPFDLSWGSSLELGRLDSSFSNKRQDWAVSSKTTIRARSENRAEPLKLIIAGAPASGKGTQCELITKKYGLTHIATGDLLRAEVEAGTEFGKKAKEYMDQGKLVPDNVVVTMVKQKLEQPNAQKKGWLLDGYPRSLSQAEVLEALSIRPTIFILLEVPEDIIIDRVVGRRIDPLTGKIYHLKYSPPERPEIALRLIQRSDDTIDRAKLRLQTHETSMEPVLMVYKDIIRKVDGNADKEIVFAKIHKILQSLEISLPGVDTGCFL